MYCIRKFPPTPKLILQTSNIRVVRFDIEILLETLVLICELFAWFQVAVIYGQKIVYFFSYESHTLRHKRYCPQIPTCLEF